MKTQTYKIARACSVVILILSAITFRASAQHEPMFTQYMFQETFINPAYAGSHDGLAANALYRNQWTGLSGSPKTETFSIHGPVKSRKIGLGLAVLNESIGVSKQLVLNVDFAYRIVMPRSVLAFGLQGGFVNDEENYTRVETNTPGDLQFSQDVRKYFLPNAGFGIYYNTKKFYAGLSIPRLLENKIDASRPEAVVRNIGNPSIWHYYLSTGYVFKLNDYIKYKPSLMIKMVQNAPLEADANMNFLFNEVLWLGASYRTGDAVSGIIGVQISKQLCIRYSYDYTTSALQNYNNGSHEVSIAYEFGSKAHKIVSPRYF